MVPRGRAIASAEVSVVDVQPGDRLLFRGGDAFYEGTTEVNEIEAALRMPTVREACQALSARPGARDLGDEGWIVVDLVGSGC